MTIEVIQGCNGFIVLKVLSYSCSILPLKKHTLLSETLDFLLYFNENLHVYLISVAPFIIIYMLCLHGKQSS